MESIWHSLLLLGQGAALLLLMSLILWYPGYVLYFILFSIPLSVDSDIAGVSLSVPCEPLLLMYSGITLLKTAFTRKISLSQLRITETPLILIWLTGLVWMIFTVIWSDYTLISIKKTVILSIFSGFFFIYLYINVKKPEEWATLLNYYIAGTVISATLVLIQHSKFHFLLNTAADIPKPYYAEHTVYGACLAFILPYSLVNIFRNRSSLLKSGIWILLTIFFSFALFASASRASWLSIFLAAVAGVLIYYRFPVRRLLIGISGLILLAFAFQGQILGYISGISAQSNNHKSDVQEHLISVMNLTTDVSNRERINRWYSAFQMFKERPLTGFGPGTYQFCYDPYQPYWLLTRISSRHGLRGNSHSEIFTFLSEQGIAGLLIGVIFTVSVLLTGLIRLYRKPENDNERLLYLAVLCGLITYSFHGFMNMFSDQIEAASIVWMSIAIIAGNLKGKKDSL